MCRSPLILIFWVTLIVSMSGCASQPMFVPREISAEEFQHKIARLQPGDVVDITDLNKKSYTLNITDKGSTFLEGHASNPGPEPWLSRHEFAKIKWLDGLIVPPDFVYDPNMAIAEPGNPEEVSLSEVARSDLNGQKEFRPESAAIPSSDEPDPAYQAVTADLRKGEMVNVVSLSGERFRVELTEIGPNYIKGIRFEESGIGGQAPPQRYELQAMESINGIFVPVDFFRFNIGDKVELVTTADKMIRMEIVHVDTDRIAGRLLGDKSSANETVQLHEFTRSDIRTIKIYKPVSEVIATTLEYVGKGILIVVGVTALFVVALLFAVAGVPPPLYP